MIKFLVFLSGFGFLSQSYATAEDMGLLLGFRSQSGEIASESYTTSSRTGYQLGGIASLDVSKPLMLRLGFMYTERPVHGKLELGTLSGEADFRLTYFDFPVALAFKIDEYISLFGGLALSVLLENSVSSATGDLRGAKISDAKAMIFPLQIGVDFRFAPQIGGNVFFEAHPSEVAKDLKNYRAIGLNFIYFLD